MKKKDKDRDSRLTPASRLLLLYFFLLENSNATHGVTMEEIRDHYIKYGIFVERKAIYADVAKLENTLPCVIPHNPSSGGYCFSEHLFEPYELRLMVDSIQASKFVTQKDADRITSKICTLTDKYTAPSLCRTSYVANRVRNKNESVVKGSGRLHEAIAQDCKVSFKYFHFQVDKSKKYSLNGKPYIVSPYALLWNNGNYYLYAYVAEKERFQHFRVDRMEAIRALFTEEREGKDLFKKTDLTARQSKVFNMYSGEEYNVQLRCINNCADAIIDRFGRDVMLIPEGDGKHFTVRVPVEVTDQFFSWVASFGRKMKIVSPAPVVEEMRKFINKVAEMYDDE